MAGAGAKLFTSGSVLTAAQVNTYLMDQAVMVLHLRQQEMQHLVVQVNQLLLKGCCVISLMKTLCFTTRAHLGLR